MWSTVLSVPPWLVFKYFIIKRICLSQISIILQLQFNYNNITYVTHILHITNYKSQFLHIPPYSHTPNGQLFK